MYIPVVFKHASKISLSPSASRSAGRRKLILDLGDYLSVTVGFLRPGEYGFLTSGVICRQVRRSVPRFLPHHATDGLPYHSSARPLSTYIAFLLLACPTYQ